MKLPFVSRKRLETLLADLIAIRDDYEYDTPADEMQDKHRNPLMASYKKGKRDAYRRAVQAIGRVL